MAETRAMQRLGAVILCGGRSRRMGRPKEWLPVGGEVLLQRVVRIVSMRASLVVLSAAEGQDLPDLPPSVEVVRDREADRGPLLGLATGMGRLVGRACWAFACASDAPLIQPAWIDCLRELASGSHDLILPHVDGRDQPLAALYRVEAAAAAAASLLDSGQARLGLLRTSLQTRIVTLDELTTADPGLLTLRNLNEPADYDRLIEELARLDASRFNPASGGSARGTAR